MDVMFFGFLLGIVTWAGAEGSSSNGETRVNVDIYYGSMCPACWEFIVDQFFPVYTTKCKKMNLQLIPFGKSDMAYNGGKFCFSCEHGPIECYGNKVHTCGLKHISAGRMKFIKCLMENAMKKPPTKECEYPLKNCLPPADVTNVEKCAQGAEGDTLLAEMGIKTSLINTTKFEMPYIVFDKRADDRMSEKAKKDFGLVFSFFEED